MTNTPSPNDQKTLFKFLVNYFDQDPSLFFLYICFFLGFVLCLLLFMWFHGFLSQKKLVYILLEFNKLHGRKLGFLYEVRFGWLGFHIKIVRLPPENKCTIEDSAEKKCNK